MSKLYIVANWKSNKTSQEVTEWFDQISKITSQTDFSDKTIIICPSFIHLPLVRALIQEHNLPFKIGAQDVSLFDRGAYTGETNAEQIKDYAQYVLIGHSERRSKLGESVDAIEKKTVQSVKQELIPVCCVQSENTPIPSECLLVAYEPPNAISTSGPDAKADSPKEVQKVIEYIKSQRENLQVLYGGSVDSKNVSLFTALDCVDGVLVGGASLNPLEFYEIIKKA